MQHPRFGADVPSVYHKAALLWKDCHAFDTTLTNFESRPDVMLTGAPCTRIFSVGGTCSIALNSAHYGLSPALRAATLFLQA